jgi:predicted ATP-grasp superfamily ATP-dependent carboligase
METQWQRIGECLTERFSLRGLFGVDAVVQDDTVWPVEVNPRYTASMELLERNLTLSIAQLHYDTCLEGRPPAPRVPATESQASLWGKAILFAPRDATVSEQLVAYACRLNAEQLWPQAADIPAPLTHVAAGRPVVTVFAEASDATQIMRTLRCRIAEMRELLIF